MIVLIQCFPCGFVSLSYWIIFLAVWFREAVFFSFSSFYLARSLNLMCVFVLDLTWLFAMLSLSDFQCSKVFNVICWSGFYDQNRFDPMFGIWFGWVNLWLNMFWSDVCSESDLPHLFDQIMSIWFYLGRIVWANLCVLSPFIVLVICLALSCWLDCLFQFEFGLCLLNCLLSIF